MLVTVLLFSHIEKDMVFSYNAEYIVGNSIIARIQISLQENNNYIYYMSHRMEKPTNCICENKGADQLRSNCEADQRLCFRYTDSTIPILLKSEISSF